MINNNTYPEYFIVSIKEIINSNSISTWKMVLSILILTLKI
jgi:hypothetical protein